MRKTIQSRNATSLLAKPLATKSLPVVSPYETRALKTIENSSAKVRSSAYSGIINRRKCTTAKQQVEDTKRAHSIKYLKSSNSNSSIPGRPWARLETSQEKRVLKPSTESNLMHQSRISKSTTQREEITEANKKAAKSFKKEHLPLMKLIKRVINNSTTTDPKISSVNSRKSATSQFVGGFKNSKETSIKSQLQTLASTICRNRSDCLQPKLMPKVKPSEHQLRFKQPKTRKPLETLEKQPVKAPSSAGNVKLINSIHNETWSETSSEQQSIPEARPTTPTCLLQTTEKADNECYFTRLRRERVSKPPSQVSLGPEASMTPGELWEKIESFSSWLAETLNLDKNGNPVRKKSIQRNSSYSKGSTSTDSSRSQRSTFSGHNLSRQKVSGRENRRVPSAKAENVPKNTDMFHAARKNICEKFPGADIQVSLDDLRLRSSSLANLPCFKDQNFFTKIKVSNSIGFANLNSEEEPLNKSSKSRAEKKVEDPIANNSCSVESLKSAFRTFQLPNWAKECFHGDDDASDTMRKCSDDFNSPSLSPVLSVESLDTPRTWQSEVVHKILSLYANKKTSPVCQAATQLKALDAVIPRDADEEFGLYEYFQVKEPDEPS